MTVLGAYFGFSELKSDKKSEIRQEFRVFMLGIGSLGKSWFLVIIVKKIIINHNVINIYSKISIIVYDL